MKKGFVYCLICPKTKKPKYVGQTIRSLEMRLEEHKYKKDQTKTHKYNWIEDLKTKNLIEELSIWKLGEYNVDIIDNMESYWIKFFESQNIKLSNSVKGGGFGGYREWKKEVNESRSIKQKGKNQKKRSEETKKKISLSLIGKPGRNTGNKHSQETKNKISASKKGTIPHNIKKIIQLDMDGNFIKEWTSSIEAANKLGISQGNIAVVASGNGRRKSTGGFKWRWVEKINENNERLERNS